MSVSEFIELLKTRAIDRVEGIADQLAGESDPEACERLVADALKAVMDELEREVRAVPSQPEPTG